MANHPHAGQLAIYDETTPFTPPANAAAWVAQARIQYVRDSLDPSSIKPAVVEDQRMQVNPLGRELNVKGLREGEIPFSVYAGGTGTTTTAGTQVAETPFSRLLESHLCGVHRTNSTACSDAGTTSTIEVTADTNFAEGAVIGWQHPTTGQIYARRLVEETAANTWSLDEDLPIASAVADVIHGAITIYPAPILMAQSNASGRQLSYWMQFGDPNIDQLETYVLIGCVNTIKAIKLNRGALPTIDLAVMYANHVLPSESPPTSISWNNPPVGVAPVAIGPEGRVFFQDVGTTAALGYCTSDVVFNPGLPRTRVPTVTEIADNAQGICHYSANFTQDAEIGFTLTPFALDEFADWAAGTLKQWRYQCGTAAGHIMAVGVPNGEVRDAPNRVVNSDATARRVMLRPHLGNDNTNNPFTTDTALTQAPYYIAML